MLNHQSQCLKARIHTIDTEAVNQRLDNYLFKQLKNIPKSHVYQLIRTGQVRVNSGRVRAHYRLALADKVRIPPVKTDSLPNAKPHIKPSLQASLRDCVVYEDERLLVLNKPSGLAVHGGSGVHHGVIETLRSLHPGKPLELVHRLDKETSGCLMVSKRMSMLRALHAQLREGGIEKVYWALLVGEWTGQDSWVVRLPLRKNVLASGERMVRVDEARGIIAETRFRVLERFKGATLVEARPITGRTHQIRVHAAHLGFPIAGDGKYGNNDKQWRRLFLHAQFLRWFDPRSNACQETSAPLDNELSRVLQTLRGS